MKKLYIIIIIDIIFMLLLTYNYLFIPRIEFNTNDIYTTVNRNYTSKNIIVKFRNKKIKNIKVSGKIDTKTIGDYTLTFTANINDKYKKTVKQVIHVIDNEKPIITLKGENEIDIDYNTEYKEDGFIVTDNYDEDLNSKVIITDNINSLVLGKYSITYSLKDSNNNETKINRIINVKDLSSPTIKLNRKKDSYVIKGNKIDINDFEAIDNYDGDITKNVQVIGNVDTSIVGIYKVSYTVKDSSNNETILNTTINVQEKNTSGVPVLMYHWFYDDTKGEKYNNINNHNYVSASNFRKQLEYLKNDNFYFPTWDELEQYIDKKIDLPKKSIILTSDDSVESFFRVAVPILKEYEIPMTSFVITKKDTWQNYINDDYIILESHTENMHVRKCPTEWDGAVMCASYNEIYEDIKTSKEKIGNNPKVFAYPFGHYNDNTIKALKENDFTLAFTINNGKVKKGSNKMKLPRVRISRTTSLEEYKKKVN